MSETRYSLRLESVSIEASGEERPSEIEDEIRRVLEPLTGVDLGLVRDVRFSILLTDRMGPAVDRINAAYGKALAVPYQPTRQSVQAAGILITDQSSQPLSATVVLDIDLWTTTSSEDVVVRMYLLGHEFGHVLQLGRGTGLDWERGPNENRTHDLEVRRAAQVLRNEFDADLTALNLCSLCLRDEDGKPVRASSCFGYRFIGAIQELLGALCCFVSDDLRACLSTEVGRDELYPKAAPLVAELLLVLAHTSALYAGDGEIESLHEALSKCNGFEEFVAQDWESFVRALVAEDSAAGEAELVRIANAMLARVGLVVEETESGDFYLQLREPVTCRPSSDSQ